MTRLPKFQNPALFTQAMTHKSYAREHPEAGGDNERLEFLGDAILTFLCGEFLFARYPDQPEGALTPLRASLVDATQLGKFAVELSLRQHLRLGRGVEGSGGRDNARLLSSAFEALVGAYFLDQRSHVDPVRQFVFPLFDSVVETLAETPPKTSTRKVPCRNGRWPSWGSFPLTRLWPSQGQIMPKSSQRWCALTVTNMAEGRDGVNKMPKKRRLEMPSSGSIDCETGRTTGSSY